MGLAFQTTDQFAAPWPAVVRPFALLARTAAAFARALARLSGSGGRVSVPPVSAAWLQAHEVESLKRQDGA
jgi:hypothetical protein